MKVVRGFNMPDGDPQAWLRDAPDIDGLPGYQYNRLHVCLELLRQRNRPMRTCIDGGAHIGTWTLHLAKHFKRVLAFEPIQSNLDCLYSNVTNLNRDANGPRNNVEVWPFALSNTADYCMNLTNGGGKSWGWTVATDQKHGVPVICKRIDDLQLPDLDLLKLDVEGHEYQALLGARETVQRCRPVVIIEEKHDAAQRASALLRSWQYNLHYVSKADRVFA